MASLIGSFFQQDFVCSVFVEQYMSFFGTFSSSSSFGRQLNQNVDERGRNIQTLIIEPPCCS